MGGGGFGLFCYDGGFQSLHLITMVCIVQDKIMYNFEKLVSYAFKQGKSLKQLTDSGTIIKLPIDCIINQTNRNKTDNWN